MSEPASERPASEIRLDRALREAYARPADRSRARAHPDASMPPESVCRVEAEIARGGMGIVYRARDPLLQREVALKLLHEELGGDPAAVERFVAEARVGGMLQHPGVVPVYACGRTQTGRPWFTMKLIEGQTLASLLAARPTPAHEQRRFLAILESVCRTIAFAHARGVVHLDLKPGNVMVGAFGEVQVVDWGLAALLPSMESALGPGRREGEVFGTPAYMPPEQARGDAGQLDLRADLFALGAILCEILSGSPPYPDGRAASRRAAAEARLDEARARLAAASPAELASLCLCCLDEDPGARPRDATEIADGIERSFAGLEARARAAEIAAAREGERARHERRARRWTVAFAATVLVVVLGAAVGWSAWSRIEATRRQAVDSRASEALGEAARLLGQAESSLDLGLYAQVRSAIDRAQALLAAGDGSAALLERASVLRARAQAEETQARLETERARTSAALLRRLEELRTPDDEDAYPSDPAERDGEYAAAFEELGLHPDLDEPQALAAELRERGLAVEVASHLDEWLDARLAGCLPGEAQLREIVPLLDPDPARAAVRKAISRRSIDELARIAQGPDLARCLPATLHAFARALREFDPAHAELALFACRAAHVARPEDYPLTIEFARCAFRCGPQYYAEGEQAYRLAQVLRPERATGFLELGWELEHLDLDYAAAAELDRRAIELQPGAGVAYFCLGRALRRLGDLDGALAAQAAATRLRPADIRPQKELAVLHRLTGALGQSIREFEELLSRYPGYGMARYEYLLTLFEAGRNDEALEQLRQASELDQPGRQRAQGIEGLLLLERGSCIEAARVLHGIQDLRDLPVLRLYMQGVRMHDYLPLDELLASTREMLEHAPSNAELYCQLGALLDASGRYAAALVAFRAGHALASGQQAWSFPSSDWVRATERRAALESRLLDLLAAHESPAAADDGLELARMAARTGQCEAAARWFAELFEREPARAAEGAARLEAACAALRCSQRMGESEPARWRDFARAWLRDELERRTAQVRSGAAPLEARRALGAWQVASELAGVREAEALASLPDAEREEWRAKWLAAEELCAEASGKIAGIPLPR